MKKLIYTSLIVLISTLTFSSCAEDDVKPSIDSRGSGGIVREDPDPIG